MHYQGCGYPHCISAHNFPQVFGDENLIGITVIDDQNKVVVAVSRMRVDHAMSGQYGFSLYARRPISNIMDSNPLVTDFSTPIDIVTKRAMSRPLKTLYDFIVVTQTASYCGMVTIKDLLEKTMPTDSFVRHIGGDDFVAIIQSHDIDPICETLIECFRSGHFGILFA